ncbi:hypothetical protein CKO23_11835 [Thiocystis violacea]|nr:hypothetical protein [Thiocystis violacea]
MISIEIGWIGGEIRPKMSLGQLEPREQDVMTIRFDDSLAALARVVATELGVGLLHSGVALRDAVGRLAFFAADPLDSEVVERVSQSMRQRLGAYARDDRVLAGRDDIGARRILDDPSRVTVDVDGCRIHLLDRRLVGADWLLAPAEPSPPPPRFVFASIKGGVGRSTALAVVAADLAYRGQRVLVIDLDLEAPGLGPMLLDDRALPEFGTLDALVENGLSGLDHSFLSDLIAPSALAGGHGRLDVMPALGRRALAHPSDVLAKIARAYAEDVGPDGQVMSFRGQVVDLIQRFSDPTKYDAILVDARAGLHESTAASFLGLGAEVLLFGLDEPQTFQGFKALFAHLARFVSVDGPLPEWLWRLTIVQGKAPLESERRDAFMEHCRDIAAEVGLTPRGAAASSDPLPAEPFGDVPWDDSMSDEQVFADQDKALVAAVQVLDDQNYRGFDPFTRRDLLSERIYSATFGSLLELIQASLSADTAPSVVHDTESPDAV